MKEIKGNIFDFLEDDETDAICITTNGVTNAEGLACMGAGTAGEAARRWKDVRAVLGKWLLGYTGNNPAPIGIINQDGSYSKPSMDRVLLKKDYKRLIFSFPTKDDFRKPAIPSLIKESAKQMAAIARDFNFKKVIIPAPGCGTKTGQLDWEKDVKPLIKDILDDRFVIVFLEE